MCALEEVKPGVAQVSVGQLPTTDSVCTSMWVLEQP